MTLAEARALVQRAVDKAEQLGLRGGIAVVGASGALITASRMDAGGPGRDGAGPLQGVDLGDAADPQRGAPAPDDVDRAAGGHRLRRGVPGGTVPRRGRDAGQRDGVVVAGIAASGATVSPFFPAGVDPRVLSADGEPANPEDLLIAYALGIPYAGQHGDDRKRWIDRFGDLVVSPAESLGMAPAPPASRQAELDWARGLCDAAMDVASHRGLQVAVAVVDRGGDPVQQDLMDGGAAGGVAIAQAVAAAAALFGYDSASLGDRFGATDALAALVVPPVLGVPGGLPVRDGGRVVAGLGVGGAGPSICEEIARTALAAL